MTTFSAVLADLVRADAGRPLITFYDDATGERVELSRVTYANWVAKTASLLVEEHDLERGQTLHLDLPAHWLGPVFLGAAWTIGLVVGGPDHADAVVCGPAGLATWAAARRRPAGPRVLPACRWAFGSPTPLPAGVHDVGVDVWSQPDAFTAWDPPGPDDLAVPELTQGEIWRAAAVGNLLSDGGRLLTEANPASPPGIASFVEPLARGGSLVLVSHADPERLEATYVAERATARFP